MSEPLIEYDFLYQFIGTAKKCTIDRRCNSWSVLNTGTTVMTVNGVPLNPGVPGTNNGESFLSGGNRGEIFRGRVDIAFAGNAGAAIFIQKIYISKEC